MRKHSSKKATRKAVKPQWSVGLDLGDRTSRYAIVDEDGELIAQGDCRNSPAGLAKAFADMPRARVALKTGPHSSWIARELTKLGHEALVANARETLGSGYHGSRRGLLIPSPLWAWSCEGSKARIFACGETPAPVRAVILSRLQSSVLARSVIPPVPAA